MKVLLFLLTVFALGCDPSLDSKSPAQPFDPIRHDVESWRHGLIDDLHERLDARLSHKFVTKILDKEAKRPWGARLKGGIKYADLFQELYADHQMVFAGANGLNERGAALLSFLEGASFHLLDPTDYHIERVRKLNESFGEPVTQEFKLSGSDLEVIVGFLSNAEADGATKKRLLLDAIIEGQIGSLSHLTDHVNSRRALIEERMEAAAELELRIADGALRFARDLRHFNLERLDWREIRDGGGSKKIIYGRLAKTFDELKNSSEPQKVLDALSPPHPQYKRLLHARTRYQTIVAEGGWKTVRPLKLKEGTRSARVQELAERLAIEGYIQAPGDTLNQELISAIHTYQRTHQFRETLEPKAGFWRSLNVGAERRLRQIETTIQRWRESRFEGEPNYIFVNIPDFHAEVWENNERKMRFRVVVGSNRRRCDPVTKKWVMPDATPTQLAFLDHLDVNPYWNVPRRIVEEEFKAQIKRDPDWLSKNNYEEVKTKKNEWIRQKPGPDNALGKVKFIFPNPHNTYMHDTPKKKYFNYPIRAFSHGCVRVEEPESLAEYLLSREEKADRDDLESLWGELKTKRFHLDEKLPVFFEYYVTQVDDDGHVHFLADIYKKDARRLSEDKDAFDNCASRLPKSEDDGDWDAPSDSTSDFGP